MLHCFHILNPVYYPCELIRKVQALWQKLAAFKQMHTLTLAIKFCTQYVTLTNDLGGIYTAVTSNLCSFRMF